MAIFGVQNLISCKIFGKFSGSGKIRLKKVLKIIAGPVSHFPPASARFI